MQYVTYSERGYDVGKIKILDYRVANERWIGDRSKPDNKIQDVMTISALLTKEEAVKMFHEDLADPTIVHTVVVHETENDDFCVLGFGKNF
jgi:hypothetical protein